MALLACCQAAVDIYPGFPKPKNNPWQKRAAILLEISVGFNIVTVILFWTILAPTVFKVIKWDGIGIWMGIRMVTLHTVPAITSCSNLIMSDIKLIKGDWKMVAFVGWIYLFANAYGTYEMR